MSKNIDNESFLKYFFEDPNRWFHVREMARLLKINPTTASTHLEEFTKKRILIKKYERRHLLFRANLEEVNYKDAKIYYNIKKIRNSGIIEYITTHLHYPQAIILFGSFSKGENDKNSDLDLFILANVKKELELPIYEEKIGSKIHLFVNTSKEFENLKKKNKNLINSIINGICLSGFIEVF